MEVDHWEQFPGYVFGNPNAVDLGFYWLKKPIPGFVDHVTFAGTSLGEILTMVDYGNIGDPTTGEMPSLGDRMAGNAPRRQTNIYPYPDSLYDYMDFNGIASVGIPLNVQGLNFSSGAPWYNNNGDLTHLLIAKTNGTASGDSICLELTDPIVQAELNPRIAASWASVPEPSTLVFTTLGFLGAACRRIRAKSSHTNASPETRVT